MKKWNIKTIINLIQPIAIISVATFFVHNSALGQSFNIDFCNNKGWVDAGYSAAANQSGLWNESNFISPLDLNGNSTGIVGTWSASNSPCRRSAAQSTVPPGNAANLLSDSRSLGAANPVGRKLTFKNLLPGKYTIYTYAWGGVPVKTSVKVNTQGEQIIGGSWPGQLTEGVTHAKHVITIASGQEIEIHLVTKQGLGGLNGIQVVHEPIIVPDCNKPVEWHNGTQIQPVYDGANCFVKEVPCCADPFIYNGNYYIKSIESPKCDLGGFDGANCFVMKKIAGGFIYNNGFYAFPNSGGGCPDGSTYDGANCFFAKAPNNTKAFEYKGGFYTTPLIESKCCFGKFDGANCKMGKAPENTTPFIFNNNFYYTPK